MQQPFAALLEVLEHVSDVYQRLGTQDLWWRGQPEAGLMLVPKVFRSYPDGTEFNLIANFDRQAPLRYANWPQEESHKLLLMQHFGLPTRLLDWTMGVLTALYFAVSEERENKDATLWALNPQELNRRQTGYPHVYSHEMKEVRELIDLAFMRPSERPQIDDRVLAMSGPELDLRMLVQWAMFTIHATGRPVQQLPDHQTFVAEITIPCKDRQPLRQALLIAGFSHARLFPDLQSLATDLRHTYERLKKQFPSR